MNKKREIAGVKVIVSGETYNEYKGTLQEQLEEKTNKIDIIKGYLLAKKDLGAKVIPIDEILELLEVKHEK